MTAKQIKSLRQRLGWTQAQLAEYLCVRQVSVCHWERGNRNPSRPIVKLLQQLRHQQKI